MQEIQTQETCDGLEIVKNKIICLINVRYCRYIELKEKDVLKFGFSSREFVVLNEKSAGDENASDPEPTSPGSE